MFLLATDKAANAPLLQSRAVFGVPLEESLAVSQIANLPSIVFRSIQYLEAKKADQEEGIYRLSGSSAVIKNLKDSFNSGKLHPLTLLHGFEITNLPQREMSICSLLMSKIHMPLLDSLKPSCGNFLLVY